ncbi:MAG: ABC transporter ATP-binding protein [Eubacteriales bacterium]|nr:ABC transporter ATP-binding protein [Eubacteriales bacterium]
MDMITARGLRKIYGSGTAQVQALRGVDLDIAAGSFTAIIGRSGSGKTTLLRILGGLERPTAGSVAVCGENLAKLSDDQLCRLRRRKIGFVFQDFRLLDDLTVWENVTLPLVLDKALPDKPYLTNILQLLLLGDKTNAFPSELSGGEKQRVAMARAYAAKPALLLADEPTGNLDRRTGEEVMRLLQTTQRELHQTVVMVTHDLDMARQTQRILQISDGVIAADTGRDVP